VKAGAAGASGENGGNTVINLTDIKTLAVGDVTKDKILVVRLLDNNEKVIAQG